jgi:hypothetical protein
MTKPTKPSTGGTAKKAPSASTAAARSTKAKGAATKPTATKSPAAGRTAVKSPPNRAQSKKIVSRRQTPWGLIATTVVIVVLAASVITYAVMKGSKKTSSGGNPDAIAGIQHYPGLTRNHVAGVVKYSQSPPVGGDHAPVWADCTGTVYPNQIANENAVHDLEHGAVWITYKPGLANDQLEVLTKLVAGNQYTLLTPYSGLKSNVSLQAWGYQLFVDSATDPRVDQFVSALKLNRSNTPEYGASCDNAAFKTAPSTPGKPTES